MPGLNRSPPGGEQDPIRQKAIPSVPGPAAIQVSATTPVMISVKPETMGNSSSHRACRAALVYGHRNGYPESGCAASRGGGWPPPNCAHATPAMVTPAPAILSQVKDSPSVSHATTPEIGGIRYMSGALRATPRTALTQAHTSQPRNADTTAAPNMPSHMPAGSCASGAARNEAKVARSS